MTKKANKFDALAHAVAVLGQPHQTGKDRSIEESHGLVADAHLWELPCGSWLAIHQWSDGDQSMGGWPPGLSYPTAVRNNDDGSLCPDYEEQARGLIDAFNEECKYHG